MHNNMCEASQRNLLAIVLLVIAENADSIVSMAVTMCTCILVIVYDLQPFKLLSGVAFLCSPASQQSINSSTASMQPLQQQASDLQLEDLLVQGLFAPDLASQVLLMCNKQCRHSAQCTSVKCS